MIDLATTYAYTHRQLENDGNQEILNLWLFVENIFSWLSSFFKSFTDQSSIQSIKKPKNDLNSPLLPDSSDQSSIQSIEEPKIDSLETPSNFSLDTTNIDCTDELQLQKDSKRNSYLIDERRIEPENVHSTLLALIEEDFKNVKSKFLGAVTQGIMLDGCLEASRHFFPNYLVTQEVGDKPEFLINTKERTVTITNHFLLLSTLDNKPYRYKLQCKTLVDFEKDDLSGKISFNFIGEAGISLG